MYIIIYVKGKEVGRLVKHHHQMTCVYISIEINNVLEVVMWEHFFSLNVI